MYKYSNGSRILRQLFTSLVTIYGHVTRYGQTSEKSSKTLGSSRSTLFSSQVFGRHIVLRDLFGVNFSHVGV